MTTNKFFQLPMDNVAMAVVLIDPLTGLPIDINLKNTMNIKDEAVLLGSTVTTLNFAGLGITATLDGSIPGQVNVTVPGVADNQPMFPPKTDGTAQTVLAIVAGTGVPNNAQGQNGWIYLRSDGGLLSTVYQKRSGSWSGLL